MSCRLGFLSFNNQIPNNKQRQRTLRPWALLAFSLINPVLFALHITMSSSINIPTRTGYAATSSKAAASSSSSSYSSSSPRTSPQNQATSTPSSPNNKYGHDRRPSLLSEFPLSSRTRKVGEAPAPGSSVCRNLGWYLGTSDEI
jgi:hypothetical protein